MSNTIVERIKEQRRARKRTREAILAAETGASPDKPRQELDAGAVLSTFTREVVPVIGKAVTSEMTGALEKVRRELVVCLDREFSRLGQAEQPVAADKADTSFVEPLSLDNSNTDTDLDLPGDDVNRQLGRGFPELEPLLEQPIRAAASPRPLSTAQAASPAALVERPAAPAAGKKSPEPPPRAAAAAEPPPRAPEPQAPLAEGGRQAAAPAALLEELRAALIPGIADAISQFMEELEKGQERLSEEVTALARRLVLLETRAHPLPESAEQGGPRREERPGSGEWPSAGSLQEFRSALIQQLGEVENRIIRRLDSLAVLLGQDQHA